ncbi:unnamed protein product, partial [Symbiodinium sp. CCMP2456]
TLRLAHRTHERAAAHARRGGGIAHSAAKRRRTRRPSRWARSPHRHPRHQRLRELCNKLAGAVADQS